MKSGLFKHKLDEAQLASLRRQFDLLLPQADLSQPMQFERIIEHYKGASGIYFWVLRSNDADELFSIYIGKTRSLANRAQNYLSGFQPHSPNDFKLRIFQAFVSEAAPGAALDLLFSRRNVEQLTASENDAIRLFNPILNKLQPATPDAKLNLQNVFAEYYRSAFERSLQDGD